MRLFASRTGNARLDRTERYAPIAFRSAAGTHIGLVRTVNEDRLLDRPDVGLWAVADGMGGHDSGDVAATIAIRALERCANDPADLSVDSIETALADANRLIRARESASGMSGCTVAGLLLQSRGFTAFWAGDSRIYRYRRDQLELLTHDHSVVQEFVDAKMIAPEQAATHPNANVVTRALGATEQTQLDIVSGSVDAGDRFLVCTDGLWGMLSSDAIARRLAFCAAQAVSGLTAAALDAGGRDNLALIVVEPT